MDLIDRILSNRNLTEAASEVVRNKGASGVDKMSYKQLKPYLDNNRTALCEQILSDAYYPSAIRGKEIPKSNGKKRLLGIPTVADRMLQQAVLRVIMPRFEYEFSENSYGFRPNRNTHQAVRQAQSYINSGYQDIVDIDLKAFFDEVSHTLLLQLLYRKIKCRSTMQLIRRWLRVPIEINGKLVKRRKGVPQGSPLSPLLSNIVLNELDKELERRQLKFIRYADDFSIYCTSKTEAQRVESQIYEFLQSKLRLPVNKEKSGIRRPLTFSLLGYAFVAIYERGTKGQYQLVVEKKRLKTFKSKLKEITRKTLPLSFDERIRKLKEVIRGWINYFKFASIYNKLRSMEGWLRNRLRYCIWHDWKKPERRRKNLIRLGVPSGKAYAFSRSRKGGWAIAQSPIMNSTVTVERLKRRKYEPLLDYYFKVSPQYQSRPLFPNF